MSRPAGRRETTSFPATVEEAELDHGLGTFQRAATLNVNAMFDQIDRKVLDRAVQALTHARRVFVMGMYEVPFGRQLPSLHHGHGISPLATGESAQR